MATKKQRAWFVDKLLRIGIVEKGTNVTTKDGYTTDWKSITEAKDLRIYTISRDADLVINSVTSTFSQIPSQFHETLTYRAIAYGYKDPRHMDFDVAQYFDNQYEVGVKEAKKYSRSNYQTSGVLKPHEF
jgi:hypothetical protein